MCRRNQNELTAIQLIASLQSDFYISGEAVLDAVRRRGCFNLIHIATSFKVDVFVSQQRAFDRCVDDRAATDVIGDASSLSAPLTTAEDIVLAQARMVSARKRNLGAAVERCDFGGEIAGQAA